MMPSTERIWTRSAATKRIAQMIGRRFAKKKTAFVLSGGGPLGAVQVGMIRALIEAEIQPDLVVGCSVGAINGAAVATDPSLNGVEQLEHFWRRVAEGDPALMPSRGRVPMLAQLARKKESVHDATVLKNLLIENFPVQTFEQLQVPFTCVATDAEAAREFWFDSGPLVEALLASAALPVVYPAVEARGRTLIDGAVLVEVPVQRAIDLGATEVYVLRVGHLEGRSRDIRRPVDAIARAYWAARRHRSDAELERAEQQCQVHRLPTGSQPSIRFDDFSQSVELGALAYKATAQYLRTGKSPSPVEGPHSPGLDGDEDNIDVEDLETGSGGLTPDRQNAGEEPVNVRLATD